MWNCSNVLLNTSSSVLLPALMSWWGKNWERGTESPISQGKQILIFFPLINSCSHNLRRFREHWKRENMKLLFLVEWNLVLHFCTWSKASFYPFTWKWNGLGWNFSWILAFEKCITVMPPKEVELKVLAYLFPLRSRVGIEMHCLEPICVIPKKHNATICNVWRFKKCKITLLEGGGLSKRDIWGTSMTFKPLTLSLEKFQADD